MLAGVMRALPTGLATFRALALLLVSACSYEPVANPVEPRRVSPEPAELLGTLDARGEYVLLGRLDADGAPSITISHWRAQEECTLRAGLRALPAGPAERPEGRKGPALYAPAGASRDEGGTELLLVDEHCNVHDGYGLINANSVRNFVSQVDGRPFFAYRDPDDTLYVLDPYVSLAPRALASGVRSVRAGLGGPKLRDDALWLIETGQLTQRSLSGTQNHVMGSDVSAMVVHPELRRVAFVDQGALFEAVAPEFAPKRIAADACGPRYRGGDLEFYAPCEQPGLVRIRISSGKIQTFDEGVFASSVQGGVQLDFIRTQDDAPQLIAQFGDGERMPVSPNFDAGDVYVLDEQHLAGRDVDQRFGVWDRSSQAFAPLFSDVQELWAHHRGKVHSYSFLLHHDFDEQGLGTLTLFQEQEPRTTTIAQGVPSSSQGGWWIEKGAGLPNYPFSTPLLVLLEDARPSAVSPERFRGRLRALAMRGEPSISLAEDVSSYLLVAAPVPGLLYAVEEGAERGLWFAAL
jgi:hypothetical protein